MKIATLLRRIAGCAAALSTGLAPPAIGQTYETLYRACYSSGLPERVIASCSVLISRRLAVGQDLATAFKNRGNAYDDTGDHVRAMADFGAALAINAEDADAFNSRGTTYTALGQYDRAVLDFDQAATLNPGSPAGLRQSMLRQGAVGPARRRIDRLQQSPAPQIRRSRRARRAGFRPSEVTTRR